MPMPYADKSKKLCARVALILGLLAGGPAVAEVELLFDWSAERCARWDIPDTPARFWRDAAGLVHMLAGAESSRASVGRDIDALTRVCGVLYAAPHDAEPAARDDRVWIASVFTRDGLHVEALGHAEYHGHRHPGACDAGDYMSCWRNAIVALESGDGGRSFTRVPGPPVAALPYVYDPEQTRRSGYFNPSNMIAAGEDLYVFVFAERYGAQQRGVCLLRRPRDGGPGDWRAWDGQGFSRRLADPYGETIADPARHVCTPLPGVAAPLSSVVRQAATGRYLAVSPMVARDADGQKRSGIWALGSPDLIHWERPVLLMEVPLLWARDCAAKAVYAYPALVDPNSSARMFDTVDEAFWLTVVRLPLDVGCHVGPERDLIRLHVNWPAQPDMPPTLTGPGPVRSDPLR